MPRHTIPLGRILGIPIGLDYSWFVIFALLTWTLAESYFPAEFKGWPPVVYWITGAATAIVFFVSVLLHELGHSVVALRYKVPVRSITLFMFGGVAQIGGEPPSAVAEFFIAIAGPLVSLALGVFFYAVQPLVGGVEPLLGLAKYLAYINLALAVFNLIPGFPLDGGRVFRAIVWAITGNMHRATMIAANVGRFFALLLIFVGVYRMFGGDLSGGIWIAFIGWFLDNAASAQLQQEVVQGLLAGHRVSQAMSTHCATVPGDLTLQDLVDEHILGGGQHCFLVNRGDDAVGLMTLQQVKEVPRSDWATTRASQVMLPFEESKSVDPDAELWTALESLDRNGVNQLPVSRNHRVIGMLSREDVISFLRTLQELGA
ncbi:MAG: site-2 protease family protein [Xanthobacteraceae bacterium]|nr:site-2 protease family protein [Xanthobacteraceae bacterium]